MDALILPACFPKARRPASTSNHERDVPVLRYAASLIDVSRIDGQCDDCRGRGDERPADLFRHVGVEVGAPLPPFGWPGGNCRPTALRDGTSVCADCANKTETADPAVSVVVGEEKNCPCFHMHSRSMPTRQPARSAREWAVPAGVVIVLLTGR